MKIQLLLHASGSGAMNYNLPAIGNCWQKTSSRQSVWFLIHHSPDLKNRLLSSPRLQPDGSKVKVAAMQLTRLTTRTLNPPMPTLMPKTFRTSRTGTKWNDSARAWSILTSILLLAGLLAGCQSPTDDPNAISYPVSAPSDLSATNTLQEGDVIQITFEGATNLNTTIKIPLDGMVLLPFVGRVKANGKAPTELETDLTALYASQVKSTKIGVMVMSSSAAIYVSGAVLRPGKIPFDRQMTVLDAVMEAGGVDHARAKLTAVRVLRIENGAQRIYHFNLKRALSGDEPLLYLKPFDTIYVPEKTFTL